MARLSLRLLGPPHIALDGRPVVGFTSVKVRALLIYLAVEADRIHSRDALAELLWPEQGAQVARNNLRQALANLRQVIDDHRATPPFLLISRDHVQFNVASDYWLDTAAFKQLLRSVAQHVHSSPAQCAACTQRLHEAVALYQGSFLHQLAVANSASFEEWALLTRERLERQAFGLLTELAAHHERCGAYNEAMTYAQRLLELEPWHEEAHRQVMRLLVRCGQRGAAIAQYKTCRRILAEELGIEPDESTTQLYQEILTERSSPAAPPPTEAADRLQLPALPAQAMPFLGRIVEQAQLVARLKQPGCRLLTLTGPAGTGKTRLAMEVASAVTGFYAGRVGFIDLSALRDPGMVIWLIAEACAAQVTAQEEVVDRVVDRLRGHELLLLLDNFEHVIAAAPLMAELLARVPGLTLLITSRIPLHLYSEHEFAITPLALPDLDQLPGPERIEQIDSVNLFIQRAQTVRPQFAVTADNARTIAEICHRVDGLPLAIELAAARVKLFTPGALLTRLNHRLAVLTDGPHDSPNRQRTMRAAIAWSYELLEPAEQQLFARLSVFVDGFRYEAVSAVCGTSELTMPLQQILEALADKSLLLHREEPDGEPRFTMLATIHEYALERLVERGEVELMRQRHVAYFTDLAEASYEALNGPQQAIWLRQLEHEHHNLRAALQSTQDLGLDELAFQLSSSLWRFWYYYGHFGEGLYWLERALALDIAVSPEARARALNGAAILAKGQGKYEQGRLLYLACLETYSEIGDELAVGYMLNNLGILALDLGDYAQARSYHEQSLALKRKLGDQMAIATSLVNLGEAVGYSGDIAQAQAYINEGVTVARTLNHVGLIITALNCLGWISLDHQCAPVARSCFHEALVLTRQLGGHHYLPELLEGMAGLAAMEGQPEQAARLIGAAEALRERSGATLTPNHRERHARVVSAINTQRDSSALHALRVSGRALPPEQTIALALDASHHEEP